MAKTIELIPDTGNVVERQIQKYNVSEETAMALRKHFEPFEKQAMEWRDKANVIVVTDSSQTDLMKEARASRLALKEIRIGIDKKHRDLKEDALRKGQLLDSIKRTLSGLIEPIEEHLQMQEDFVKIQEQTRIRELTEERCKLLFEYIGEAANSIPLGELSEDAFDTLLHGQKLAREQKEKEARQAEADQKEQQRKKDEEDKRIRDENELLKKKNEKAVATAKKEREERLRLEREQREREEREVEQKKKKQAEDRKAKRAPDKQKLIDFSMRIESLWISMGSLHSSLKDEESTKIMSKAGKMLMDASDFVKTSAGKL